MDAAEETKESTLGSYPSLVNYSFEERSLHFLNLLQNKHECMKVPENFFLACGCYSSEWFVIKGEISEDCYLWNPKTRDQVLIPPIKYYCRSGFLSSAPTNSDCQLVLLTAEEVGEENDKVILFYKLGHDAYIEYRCTLDDDVHCTFSHGKLYALEGSEFSSLRTISYNGTEVEDEIWETRISKPLHPESYLPLYAYLLQSGNEILLVMKMYVLWNWRKPLIRDIIVFQYDHREKSWVKIDNIGERTIFLSIFFNGSKCCSEVPLGIKKGCIYFIEFWSSLLHVYDMEDNSFSTDLPPSIVTQNGEVIDFITWSVYFVCFWALS